MMSQPEIIVAEIGDELTARFLQSAIVGSRLVPRVGGKIDPSEARVLDRRHDLFAVIRASVPDDQKLEVAEGLAEYAVDRKRQHRAPVIGRYDHGGAGRVHASIS